MGSIGGHKQYLQQGNFENLDEFDEQVFNDNIVQGNVGSSQFEASSRDVQTLVNNIERLQNANRLTLSQETKLNEYLSTAQLVLDAYDLKDSDRRKILRVLR